MSEIYEAAVEIRAKLNDVHDDLDAIQQTLADFAVTRQTEPPAAAVMVFASLIQHFCFAQRGIQPTIVEMRAFAEVALNAAEALHNVHFERRVEIACSKKKEAGE